MHLGGLLPRQRLHRLGYAVHRPRARVHDGAACNPSKRVVVNPAPGRDRVPRTVSLPGLERLNKFIEAHGTTLLGANALLVKARAPKAAPPNPGHSDSVASNRFPEPKTIFQANLQALIGAASVNEWATAHNLVQTTVNRLVHGAEPKLSMIELIADRTGREAWELLAPNLGAGGERFDALSGNESQLVMLYRRIPAERRIDALAHINSLGNHPDEAPSPANPWPKAKVPRKEGATSHAFRLGEQPTAKKRSGAK